MMERLASPYTPRFYLIVSRTVSIFVLRPIQSLLSMESSIKPIPQLLVSTVFHIYSLLLLSTLSPIFNIWSDPRNGANQTLQISSMLTIANKRALHSAIAHLVTFHCFASLLRIQETLRSVARNVTMLPEQSFSMYLSRFNSLFPVTSSAIHVQELPDNIGDSNLDAVLNCSQISCI